MKRAVTLATPHGPLPCTLTLPEAPVGLALLATPPDGPVPALAETLHAQQLAVLTPELLSPREQHFPDTLHNVSLLTERLLLALEFADRDGDTAGLPVGIYASAPLAPAAIRAAARRDAQVAALVCHGGVIDLAGLQYLELLAVPLLMVFDAEDGVGPPAFRRATPHLHGYWQELRLAPGETGFTAVARWFQAHPGRRQPPRFAQGDGKPG